ETLSKVVNTACVFQYIFHASAVGTRQPPRVVITEERPAPQCLLNQRVDAVMGKVAAGQRTLGGPALRPRKEMCEPIEHVFGEPPVGGDLPAIHGQQRRLAKALVEHQRVLAADVLWLAGAVVVKRPYARKRPNHVG